MSNQFQIPRGIPIQPPQKGNTQSPQSNRTKGPSFQEIFHEQLGKDDVKFSAHAQKRLEHGNIKLSDSQQQSLAAAIDKAADKGSKETLVLMGDLAFVVGVANRTVITVVDGERMRDNVFTKIDSAVIT